MLIKREGRREEEEEEEEEEEVAAAPEERRTSLPKAHPTAEEEEGGIAIVYRPPTPPLSHNRDSPAAEEAEDNEFLTYEELEQVGEVECLQGQPDILHDIEYQLITTGSTTSLDTTAEELCQKDRVLEVMEQALEQVSQESSQEPTLSCFTIREDFADDEEDDPSTQITEEEMQQARQEIQEIRQLLAGVSSEVIDQQVLWQCRRIG